MRTDPRFGHPFPLLGFYRDREPEIAAWQIKWAVEHDIVFFAFDWYCDYKTGHIRNRNAALEQGFLNARYREQLRFILESRVFGKSPLCGETGWRCGRGCALMEKHDSTNATPLGSKIQP